MHIYGVILVEFYRQHTHKKLVIIIVSFDLRLQMKANSTYGGFSEYVKLLRMADKGVILQIGDGRGELTTPLQEINNFPKYVSKLELFGI
jgi:hypothetical protein